MEQRLLKKEKDIEQ
jgi:hypothetical protein